MIYKHRYNDIDTRSARVRLCVCVCDKCIHKMAEHRNAHMQTVGRGTVMQSAMAAKCNAALATPML